MKSIRRWGLGAGLVLLVAMTGPQAAQARPPVKVDILFMNHGPMQPVIKGLKEVLSHHAGTVSPFWHDFEQPEGQDFMRQKGIKGHIPLLILIDGSPTGQVQGRQVTFRGFPSGYGPYQFRGQWTVEDLDLLLGSLASRP